MNGNYKDLLIEFVKTDFKLRYKNSVLGFVWVLLKPFLLFLVLYFVFGFLFSAYIENYKLELLLGLIIFYFFSEATTRGLTSLHDRSSIILKVNFSRQIAVLAPIINAFINFLFSMVVFFIFWAITPTDITWWWLIFPFYVAILGAFIVGFSLFTSVWFAKAKDLANIWEVILNILFYASPIIYPIEALPPQFHSLVVLNPLTAIIRDARLIMVRGSVPGVYSLIYVGGVGVILILLGWWYFRRNVKKIAEEL